MSNQHPNYVSPDVAQDIYDDEYDDDFDQADCWNCGGEGFVSNCFEEYACIDPEGGCDACTRRCEVCNQRKSTTPPEAKPDV